MSACRWFYFFALFPFLWLGVRYAVHTLFRLVEWYYFKEVIYYWSSLRRSTGFLVFTLLLLAWFQLLFRVVWCVNNRCAANAAYVAVRRTQSYVLLFRQGHA
jgi:hypothetical protein